MSLLLFRFHGWFSATLLLVFVTGCVSPYSHAPATGGFYGIAVPYAEFLALNQENAADSARLAAVSSDSTLTPEARRQGQDDYDHKFAGLVRRALATNPSGYDAFVAVLLSQEEKAVAGLLTVTAASPSDARARELEIREAHTRVLREVSPDQPERLAAYIEKREARRNAGRAFRDKMEARRQAAAPNALAVAQAGQAAAPAKDQVLWNYRVGVSALRAGKVDLAREQFDAALARTGDLLSSKSSGAAARKLFEEESKKGFAGEPYERVMAAFYRGLIYWMDGEPDNARAMFRTGEFIDGDTENKVYAGDWVTLDYLDGVSSVRLGGDGTEAFARARKNFAIEGLPKDHDSSANVIVVLEHGPAPRKVAAGEYQEKLMFFKGEEFPRAWLLEESVAAGLVQAAYVPYYSTMDISQVPGVPRLAAVGWLQLEVDGQTFDVPNFDDLYFQASTRGGRAMDFVLGNKAVFKKAGADVGDIAIAGGVATALATSGDNAVIGLGLVAIGATTKMITKAIKAQADTRAWDNLPGKLGAVQLRLPPGEHIARILVYSRLGYVLEGRTQRFTITVPATSGGAPAGDVVVFRSDVVN